MVAHLQNVCMQQARVVLGKHGVFHLFLRVAGQQEAPLAVLKSQHQRIIVLRSGRYLVGRNLRPQKSHANAIPIE
jgi:hypothetical protein